MKGIAAAVLTFEAIVVLLGGLLVVTSTDESATVVWIVAGVISLLCVLGAGTLRRGSVGWVVGSVVQVLVLASGFVEPVMFFLGAVFAGLWVMAYVLGRRLEELARTRAGDGA